MIRKGELNMASIKDFTVEELKKMHEDAAKEYETIGEMLKQKEQEEKEQKEAQLALEKEARQKEVDDAFKNYSKLLKAYIRDYGSYIKATEAEGFFPNEFWRGFF